MPGGRPQLRRSRPVPQPRGETDNPPAPVVKKPPKCEPDYAKICEKLKQDKEFCQKVSALIDKQKLAQDAANLIDTEQIADVAAKKIKVPSVDELAKALQPLFPKPRTNEEITNLAKGITPDYDTIASELEKRLSPIKVHQYNEDGTFVGEQLYPYPGPINYRHKQVQ